MVCTELFRFLHAKISAMPLQSVIADIEDAMEKHYDNDVKLLDDALRLSASTLSHHPDMLGPMIVGRLLPYYNSHDKIQNLIRQCDSDGLEVSSSQYDSDGLEVSYVRIISVTVMVSR